MSAARGLPIVAFGRGAPPAPEADARLVGSKAAGLMRMDALGLPVPPGWVPGRELCRRYHEEGARLPAGLREELTAALRLLEQQNLVAHSGEGRGRGHTAHP